MPKATKRLVCYENMSEIRRARGFHFFTIEAKKGLMSADDTVGKRQSLNNASQALHNMFEFFRDAGPQHEDIFFTKVRFFSVWPVRRHLQSAFIEQPESLLMGLTKASS